MTAIQRLRTGSGALVRVAVVALATHAVVYRSLLPADGDHGYFGWYAPLVAGLSVAALLGTLGVLLARATGIGGSWVPRVAAIAEPSDGVSVAVSRLAGKALAFLVVQETLERSIPARSFEPAQFSPAAVARGARDDRPCGDHPRLGEPGPIAARAATRRRPLRRGRPARVPRSRSRRSFAPTAGNPLASFRGLRAPPVPIRA